ncbi:MAG: DNA mismatch repair protein MutS [Chloroflexota bacterium]|nr:DNA mismatch repair protein MutS [Chloroflexota bacterium]
MHRQYKRIKKQYPDAIVFFRLGDFYETFDDDAPIVAQVCDVVLTKRNFAKGENMPMAGVPYHSAETYIAKLIAAGYKVAVAEQMQQPRADEETERRRIRLGKRESPVTANWGQDAPSEAARGDLVDRQVVRVVTPGTLVEPALLDARRNNYLAAVVMDGDRAGIAYVDITTGEFQATEVRSAAELSTLVQQELDRLQPSELLVPRATAQDGTRADYRAWAAEADDDLTPQPPPLRREGELDVNSSPLKGEGSASSSSPPFVGEGLGERSSSPRRKHHTERAAQNWRVGGHITPTEARTWTLDNARTTLMAQFKVTALEGFGVAKSPVATRAAGAIIAYLKETHSAALQQLTHLSSYSTEGYMALDPATRRNLELVAGPSGGLHFSLLSVIDQTLTPMGSRLLARWLNQPLVDLPRLSARQDAVTLLYRDEGLRGELRGLLKGMADLERLTNRVLQGIAGPRDLNALRNALLVIPGIRAAFEASGDWQPAPAPPGPLVMERRAESAASSAATDNPQSAIRNPQSTSTFGSLLTRLHPCTDVLDAITCAIAEEPPAVLGTGDAIRPGFNPDLDQLREASRNAQGWVANLEEEERTRSGIPSLKVGYNKIFGYYIEISNAHKDRIPANYIRRQTLVSGERYITPELKEAESLILNAKERLVDLERSLFQEVLATVAACAERLLQVAQAVAHMDVFAALAEVAVTRNYVRPELLTEGPIEIAQGRHPVVERSVRDEVFVPNDVRLDAADCAIILLTGPNMAGKSVYLKSIAQIVLLAQIGAYVPADRARLGLVDRIFTRVGAQDDIATGQSTFMVEMVETANILNHATPRSLIILDEIGRGTSTYDGLAIARAVVEYIHNHPRLGAKTLFATHYHELTELERVLPRVRNFNVAVTEEGEELVFLRKIVPGGADRSYGIHVARLAGVPKTILKRAADILRDLEAGGSKERRRAVMAVPTDGPTDGQLSFLAPSAATNGTAANGATATSAEPNPQSALRNPQSVELDPLIEELRDLKVDDMTPIEAMGKLYDLRQKARAALTD